MQRERLLQGALFLNVALLALAACDSHSISGNKITGAGGAGGATASSSSGGAGGATTGTGGGATTAGTGGASATATASASSSGAGGGVACAPEAEHVYAISTDKKLYRIDFDSSQPHPWSGALVGAITCATAADPYSIAIDRSGLAWVVYTDGNLFKVDTTTAACTATAFVPGQHGFTSFSVAFAADTPGGDTETLYASGSGISGSATDLATIDRSSLTLSPVGSYTIPPMGSAPVTAPVQLAGGADAKLSGGFLVNNSYWYGAFDPTNAHTIETLNDPGILIHGFPATTRYAIIPWGIYFQIFITAPGGTKNYFYSHMGAISTDADPADVLPFSLLTLSASTCATANQTP